MAQTNTDPASASVESPPRPARARNLILRPWLALVWSLSRGVDRGQVFQEVCDSGQMSGRYVMMSVVSAAIATLGLLLSSPAVVIGAMLLSPLMGPIILLGFSFRKIDWIGTRRAVQSLVVGLGVSLLVAIVLTWLSPLKEPTAEILARTRPNLFDLLVAAFSGIAGAYAVIRRRGETAIGVAIATALMPPLATIGFGLGTSNWNIAVGATLLFATNLVAISLAAAGMAALYGFEPHYHLAQRGWIGHVAVGLVVVALCVPLTLSLETIARESRATVRARGVIAALFDDKARIASLSVRNQKHALEVEGLVATPRYIEDANGKVARQLQAALGLPAHVTLDQVVLADPAKFAPVPAAAPPEPDPTAVAVQALRDAVPFPTAALAYDPAARRGVVLLGPDSGLDLGGAMALEAGLRARAGLATTQVVPPLQPLPAVPLELAKDQPPSFGPELKVAAWTLGRWRAQGAAASLCGLPSRDKRRAAVEAAVVDALKPLPVAFSGAGAPPCPHGSGRHVSLLLSAG